MKAECVGNATVVAATLSASLVSHLILSTLLNVYMLTTTRLDSRKQLGQLVPLLAVGLRQVQVYLLHRRRIR